MKGELAEGVLPGVLRTLYVERRTGLLHVRRGDERASVCFIQGNLMYGHTNMPECHLGETIVRHGLITQWDRERAAEMVTVTGRRLGQILVDLGCLDEDGLDEAVALHVREVLLTIFSWRDGSYEFEEQEPVAFRGFDRPLKLSTGEVILDAVWSITDPDVVRFALGDLDRVLSLASDPLLRFQRIALSPTDGFVLSRVDGTLTARQILALAPVAPEEAQRSLFGLLYTGMVEYVAQVAASRQPSRRDLRQHVIDAHAAIAGQDHYAVLGLTREAPPAEILAAYFRLARLYHPDGHHQSGLEDLKDRFETLFARVTEAHRTLSNPQARAAYDAELSGRQGVAAAAAAAAAAPPPAAASDPKQIDEILERAEHSLAAGRYYEVFALVEEALAAARGRARRRCRVLRAEAHLRSGARRTAEDELKAALEEDPGNVEAHVLLGSIYKSGGAHTLAAAAFRRALALKPRHAAALSELQSLPVEEPRARSGLRRFFPGS
jgi:curved DNA-binding protein CbpA